MKLLFSFIITTLFISPSLKAQIINVNNDSKDCVICHVEWHGDRNNPQQLVGEYHTAIMIDGKPALSSHEEMCLSCHDGYIMDSRESFLTKNHFYDLNQANVNILDLPLSTNNEIYCGTCHTPHAIKSESTISLKPFLRSNSSNSALCLSCHSIQNEDHFNHPIHVKQENFPTDLLDNNLTDNVECLTCHNMHNHQSTKMTENGNYTALCNECHSDQFALLNSDHDLQHINSNNLCNGCHLPHNGNDNFMWSQSLSNTQDSNRFCTECHSQNGLGKDKIFSQHGHPVDTKIIKDCSDNNIAENNTEIQCTSCHDPHRWSHTYAELTTENEEGNSHTSFLKLPDDENGQLCVACHKNESEVILSDHSIKRDGFKHVQLEPHHNSGQCTVCHNTHDDSYQFSQIGEFESKTTALCLSCHENTENITSIGEHTHPIGVNFESQALLPSIENNHEKIMGCETCHDPHIWGNDISDNNGHNLDGDGYSSFLRIPSSPNAELCTTCHLDEKVVLGSEHDVTSNSENDNACDACHSTHNALTTHGLMDTLATNQETFGEQVCNTCHSEDGIAKEKNPKSAWHPMKYKPLNTISLATQDECASEHGYIDCMSCHNPHQWSYNPVLNVPDTTNIEGDYRTSFLKNPSHDTLCNECHDKDALWKYIYYHDDEKRKQF